MPAPKKSGTFQLHQGDCLQLMQALPAASVDLVLADLPFGITDLHWDKRIDLTRLWAEYRRLLRPRGAVLLFATQPFATDLINAARKWFRYEWIWQKPAPTGFLNARKLPMRRHENILVFYARLPHYRPQGLRKLLKRRGDHQAKEGVYVKYSWTTFRTGWPQSILTDKSFRVGERREPCEKPQDLLRFFIETYTQRGATVLDNVMGLGSCGEAAVRLGRNFIGMEMDAERFARARQRIEDAQAGRQAGRQAGKEAQPCGRVAAAAPSQPAIHGTGAARVEVATCGIASQPASQPASRSPQKEGADLRRAIATGRPRTSSATASARFATDGTDGRTDGQPEPQPGGKGTFRSAEGQSADASAGRSGARHGRNAPQLWSGLRRAAQRRAVARASAKESTVTAGCEAATQQVCKEAVNGAKTPRSRAVQDRPRNASKAACAGGPALSARRAAL